VCGAFLSSGEGDGARLVVIEAAGHLPNIEGPDAFNAALLEFLCGQR